MIIFLQEAWSQFFSMQQPVIYYSYRIWYINNNIILSNKINKIDTY